MSAADTHYVILPGLEGAGHYDGIVRDALARRGTVEILPFPQLATTDYAPLADSVASRLPQRPFVLVAQSFSGPLAIMLARGQIAGLQGLVLAATFACLLHPLRGLAQRLAASVDPRRLPVAAASRVMWQGFDSRARRDALRSDLQTIPADVLSARALAALRVDVREGRPLSLPVLILASRHDPIVPARAAHTLLDVAPDAEYVELDAPHMLLQARTAQAAGLIAEFVARRIATT